MSADQAPNAFYAQSGGVTAVINASALGVIQTAAAYPDKIGKIYAGQNGILGALREELIDVSQESPEAIQGLMTTPSGPLAPAATSSKASMRIEPNTSV